MDTISMHKKNFLVSFSTRLIIRKFERAIARETLAYLSILPADQQGNIFECSVPTQRDI